MLNNQDAALFPLRIKTKPVLCLWDTGAQVCLMSRRMVAKLQAKLDPIQGDPVKIKGIGEGFISPKFTTTVPIKFDDGVARPAMFYICDQVPHEILLGMDFMSAYKIGFVPCGATDDTQIQLWCNGKVIACNQILENFY